MKQSRKVVIIGAGFVGSSIAFAMTLNRVANEIVLVDVNNAKAYGEALDISHALVYSGQLSVRSGDYSECKDADVIVITAGANRKPGETRIDLANKNAGIFKEICENINKHYTKGIVLLVANPVDVLTYLAYKWLNVPKNMIFGTGTSLDTARLRYILSQKLDIDIRNIHAYILGEHGDSQVIAWSVTHVAGVKIDEYCKMNNITLTEQDKKDITEEVKKAGAIVIQNKGATYYGIAAAVCSLVEVVTKNQRTIRTVGRLVEGTYGISDVAISLPAIVGAGGISEPMELTLTDEELAAVKASAQALKECIASLSI